MRRLLAKIDRWLRPRCAVEGCDRRDYFAGLCREHLDEGHRKWAENRARQKWGRDVEVQVEARRRYDAEKFDAAAEPSTGTEKR